MSAPVRVLLCDDSAVVRRIIKTALKTIPDLSIVGEAPNGKEAQSLARSTSPDVIVMDVEMPVMDGIDAVRQLRASGINTPVIMFSSLTSRGAEATMDAIEAGANDFATKPANVGHVQNALKHVRDELVTAIRRWTQKVAPAAPRRAAPVRQQPQAEKKPQVAPQRQAMPVKAQSPLRNIGQISAIGIGISTGGPQALSSLFKEIPKELSVPVFIVQHMPPVFTGLLAERLAKIKGHRVREATDGESIVPGDVIIAPGDFHMTICHRNSVLTTKLNQGPLVNSCRPAVDPLFASLAKEFGRKCLGIVMTGMGKDGLAGAKALKNAGSKVIVQDEESSVIWGMPGVVYEQGLADRVLSIRNLAKAVTEAVAPELVVQN